jgi:hypothetical protein
MTIETTSSPLLTREQVRLSAARTGSSPTPLPGHQKAPKLLEEVGD